MQLKAQGLTLDLTYPQVMGILNVTPDSFSDGVNTMVAMPLCAMLRP